MLDLFGSTQQALDQLSQSLNFNPQKQIGSGSGNYMSANPVFEQESKQSSTQEKTDTMETAASVGVGVGGGSGSGGTATLDKDTVTSTISSLQTYLPYILIGGVVLIAAGILFFRKKKKKK